MNIQGLVDDLGLQGIAIIAGFFVAGFALVWLFFALGEKRGPKGQENPRDKGEIPPVVDKRPR
jgi:hypothetical protein